MTPLAHFALLRWGDGRLVYWFLEDEAISRGWLYAPVF